MQHGPQQKLGGDTIQHGPQQKPEGDTMRSQRVRRSNLVKTTVVLLIYVVKSGKSLVRDRGKNKSTYKSWLQQLSYDNVQKYLFTCCKPYLE
jgi:hypothetical protein